MKPLIEEGDNVIFKKDGASRVFQVRKKRTVYFSKSKFCVDELIGQPYGTSFELDRGKLTKVEAQSTDETLPGAMSLDQTADNRHLVDTDKNQKMSKDDIKKMKDEGMTGEKIIEELVENSETFKSKTEFSQAKYLKKKKKKHMLIFTVYRPTLRLVMEMYAKEPGKLNFLRPDSLSQLLCFSNIMYGSKVAVMETSQGLVVGAVLQRMGGVGKLIQLVPSNGNPPCRQITGYFDFPKEHMDNLYTFPLDQLATLLTETDNSDLENGKGDVQMAPGEAEKVDKTASEKIKDETEGAEVAETSDASNVGASADVGDDTAKCEGTDSSKAIDQTEEMDCGGDTPGSKPDIPGTSASESQKEEKPFVKNRDLQRRARAIRLKEAGNVIKNKQLDSLIIACKQNPVPVMKRMLNFMAPSKPVVVYCQYLDPLVECYTYVKEKHFGIQLKLSDTWFREYQVLPQRTHPTVSMSGTGGYLLTFLTTQPSPSS